MFLKLDHPTAYPATIIDKYNRLEKLKKSETIIIAGGSSSCYSIDSDLLEKTFSLPVVNTSLAMSLGSYFQLNILKSSLKKGDVILYFPEYEFYYSNLEGGDMLYSSFYFHPNIVKDFTHKQKLNLFLKSFKLTINGIRNSSFKRPSKTNSKITQYSRLAYNNNGDNTFLLKETTSKFDRNLLNRYQKMKSKKISSEYIQFLKEFKAYCISKEVTFVIGFPPVAAIDYDIQFQKDAKTIQQNLKHTFLGTATKNVFNDSLFYDTSYHMIGEGRKLRTTLLINDLKNTTIFN
jgi:hypothetical protein